MEWFTAPEYWFSRLVLERGIAGVYLIAFICAARQFRALLGAQGMLPIPRYLSAVSVRQAPSIFHWHYSDRLFATVAWSGAVLSAALVAGAGDLVPLWAAMLTWLLLWVLYLSIVNVGQRWYGFGWESLLLEAGFRLDRLVEWAPSPEQVAAEPGWAKERERPFFLLIAASRA